MATIQMAGKGDEPRTHDSYDVSQERFDAACAQEVERRSLGRLSM
jgi:hypothetical protein